MKDGIKKKQRKFNSTAILAGGFLVVILIGTLLLMLPISSSSGETTDFSDCLFTSVSATCVTGLTTVNTAAHWSHFGQIVILCMIQIGGLGFMMITVLLSLLIKRNLTPRERMLVMKSYNIEQYDTTLQLVRRICIGTFGIEFIGTCVFSIRFIPDFGVGEGIFKSVFHSVSAFCNAGFDIVGAGNPSITSMSHYTTDPLVSITIMALIIIGGIGFVVWNDIINLITRRMRLSVYSRLVLIVTAILLVGGALGIAVLEWNNPQTLGSLSFGEKILASSFQSTTLRTAGFEMLDNSAMNDATLLLSMILMFIGGASGSTAGGVKVATVGIILYSVARVFFGKREIILFKRKVTDDTFVRAASIVIIQLILVIIGTGLISANEEYGILSVLFEVASATGTVGLTLGITPLLSDFSQAILMLGMYFGRVGILTVTYAIMLKLNDNDTAVTYPKTNIMIG